MDELFNYASKLHKQIISEVENSQLPELFLDDFPFVLASQDEATLNMLFGDSGVGKTLLNQCLINSLLDNYDDVIVVWFDLEYQSSVAKQRGIHNINSDRFFYLATTSTAIEEYEKLTQKKFTTSRFIYDLTKSISEHYKYKRCVVFVDSLEDMLNDTSDDKEIKKVFSDMLRLKGVSFVLSHHIAKADISTALRFRGSMVIKAKLSSLVYVEKKEDINDFEAEYSLQIVKIRTLWEGNRKITVIIDKQNMRIKNIDIMHDSTQKKVMREAYFLLKKHNKLKKTELIEMISKSIKISKESVRKIIDANSDLFTISVLSHNRQEYSINLKKIDEFCVVIGIDNELSDTKKALIHLIDSVDNAKFEVRRDDGSLVVHTVDSIRNSIYKMSDNEANQIIQLIKQQSNEDEDDIVDF